MEAVTKPVRLERLWTAGEFMVMDQRVFGGMDGVPRLDRIGIAVPLAEVCAFVALPRGPASEASAP